MQKNKTTLLTSLIVLIIAIGCNSTGRLYRGDEKKRIYIGKLSDLKFQRLKDFLFASTNSVVNDTIIIKYDYNNESCWEILDLKDDLIEVIIRKEEAFWKRVENRDPPMPDWGWDNENTLKLLKRVYN